MSVSKTLGVQKEVRLSQGVIRYREIGSGEPILFVHGALVNGDLWRKVVPLLAPRYRCIIPDWPLGSHELAMNPDADLSIPAIARLISDFMVALELTGITLVGNDSGGAISQVVITEHPERVKRLVLTNCDAFENFPPLLFKPFIWAGFVPGAVFLMAQLLKLNVAAKLLIRLLAKSRVEPEIIASYLRTGLQQPTVRRDIGKLLRGVSNRYTLQAATRFREFKKPVLIAWGKEDPFFRAKDAKRLYKSFPNARLEYIENALTFVMEDQPQRLAELIEAFIIEPVEVPVNPHS
jgi:pimeloyl-ACP methyl ester carboxylesterase